MLDEVVGAERSEGVTQPMERHLPSFLLLPAKFANADDLFGFHPLICHMLDVASVAGEIWDDVLPRREQAHLAEALGLNSHAARRWCGFLAGLHDVGKASPAFLAHPAAAGVWPLLEPQFSRDSSVKPADAPHGRVTTLDLRDLLQTECGVSSTVAWRLAVISGGHHGVLPSKSDLDDLSERASGRRSWKTARRTLFGALAEDLGVGSDEAPSALPNDAAVIFAGLISVADWIGSDDTSFPYFVPDARVLPSEAEFSRYKQTSRPRAAAALERMLWRAPAADREPRSFGALFDGRVPRPLQERTLSLSTELRSPSIVLIEAPTGEGKTEAALTLAYRGLANGDERGLYLALPTQASSDQMYHRAHAFLARAYTNQTVLLQLLHGHASLSAEFNKNLERERDVMPDEMGTDGDAADNVMAGEWFTYRKRGLLAPFGVGTVDQALLAVLQARHLFVRLFGLANKTIVLDEVHAYDTYMTELIERLVEWLAALRASVVLLSATLPAGRSRRLLCAYARGLRAPESDVADFAPYPRVSWYSRKEAGSTHVEASAGSSRTLQVRTIDGPLDADESFRLVQTLRELLADGGCAVVICNTVRRAQSVYRALSPHFAGIGDDGLPQLDLLHARFPFEERQKRERRCLDRFGPPAGAAAEGPADDGGSTGESGPARRPSRTVLVATQIVEQSLDIDFDVMVTDFAPVDLLLQRAGRLHRHARTRPARLASPLLYVCFPRAGADFDKSDAAVYERHVLLRTWLALRGRETIVVPDEMDTLIEAVYSDAATCPDGAGEAIARAWEATAADLSKSREHDQQEARDRWIRHPHYEGELYELTRDRREEDAPEFHVAHQALTRLADPTVQVICLSGTADAPKFSDETPVDLAGDPGVAMARRLLHRSLPVSQPGLVQALIERPPPTGWRRSPLLRHHRLLAFDSAGTCRVGGWLLRLDDGTGLEILRMERG